MMEVAIQDIFCITMLHLRIGQHLALKPGFCPLVMVVTEAPTRQLRVVVEMWIGPCFYLLTAHVKQTTYVKETSQLQIYPGWLGFDAPLLGIYYPDTMTLVIVICCQIP